MTEIVFCNTKEGMHLTAKQSGIKAWALGCSCCECNREFERILKMTNHICNCANRPKGSMAFCTNCGGDIVSSVGKEMSVKELVIVQDGYKLKLMAPIKEHGEDWYSLSLDAKCILLDRNQAHLLMLWLQEHLK